MAAGTAHVQRTGMRVHVQPAADGFWIDPMGYPPGSVIHYRCHLGGVLQQATAELETGRRQFIYTGDPPTDIVVTQIVPPSGMTPTPGQPSVWPIPIPTPRTPPSVAQYPTAMPVTPVDETAGGGDFGGEPTSSAAPAEKPAAGAGAIRRRTEASRFSRLVHSRMLNHDAAAASGRYRTVVFGEGSPAFLADRTLRALTAHDINGEDVSRLSPHAMAARLAGGAVAVWFIRTGSWPARGVPPAALRRSGTGHALCALGATLTAHGMAEHADAAAWKTAILATGSSFHPIVGEAAKLPPLDSFYLEPPVLAAVISRLSSGQDLMAAVLAEISTEGRRIVRVSAFDVHRDTALRVAQVVTTLQRGGAERIALELHRKFGASVGHSRLITLGQPTRAPFPTPPSTSDVFRAGSTRATRIPAALREVRAFAADVVHGHLLDAPDIRQFATAGVPLVLTIHNIAAGLAGRTGNARPRRRRAAGGLCPRRGGRIAGEPQRGQGRGDFRICRYKSRDSPLNPDANCLERDRFWDLPPHARGTRCRMRNAAASGYRDGAFVLVALANPRPQKRMERLPGVVAATRKEFDRRNINREVALLVAGEPSRASPTATAAEAAIRAAIDEHRLDGYVHFLGAVEEVPIVLAASDALVCVSGYEGLSLAHVEAWLPICP